jgi:transposase
MLKEINPHAAGIDVGSEQIFVGMAGQPVRSFETFTASFESAREYLKHHHVTTVAMEATGGLLDRALRGARKSRH